MSVHIRYIYEISNLWYSFYYCVLVFCLRLQLLHYSSCSFPSQKVSLPVTNSTEDSLLRNHYSLSCSDIFLHFMEPKGLLLCPQEPTSHRYPKSDESSQYHNIIYFRSILMLSSHLCLCLPRDAFPSCCQTTFP
jgi:hypothetical protein